MLPGCSRGIAARPQASDCCASAQPESAAQQATAHTASPSPVLTEEGCADAESMTRALRVATDIRSS